MKKFLTRILPLVIVAVAFGTTGAGTASAQNVINEILKRMDAQNKSITSLRANVRMAKVNAQLGDDAEVTEGVALYLPRAKRDPLIRIDWKKPDESLAVVDKKYVIYRPRLSQAYTGLTSSAKGSAKASGALAFMNMSRAQLKANYTVRYLGEATVAGGTSTWHLELIPKAKTSYKSSEIWVDKDGFPVQSKVVETNNDTTTVLLSKIEKNIDLNAAAFQISLPRGTKIMKS